MSIVIKNLTKIFGDQKAVNDISFEIGDGEIVGFLGPNGAGKSTTMKIANCYLPPTSGTVEIGGHNVISSPLEVRKMTGYLPEQNPLYTEMYVHEYLRFTGKLYGIKGKSLTDRVAEMIELTGLTREQNKKIESLSKGYKQRVGLAQSLLHNPKILILDEPTTGLDPNQIIEIRNLIKDISINKTVMFSTHIMQEVQAICDRVILIDKGQLVADDSIGNLLNNQTSYLIQVEFESMPVKEDFSGLQSIINISEGEGQKLIFETETDIRSAIMKCAAEKNIMIIGIHIKESNLETIFHQLTSGKHD